MNSFQSFGAQLMGESEERCAERWFDLYGPTRATNMVDVFMATVTNKSVYNYYRRVGSELSKMPFSNKPQPDLWPTMVQALA